jgi:uncharacterized RDD family membrane protein YckC
MPWAPPNPTIPAPYPTVRHRTEFAPAWRRFVSDIVDVGLLAVVVGTAGLLVWWWASNRFDNDLNEETGDVFTILIVAILLLVAAPLAWCITLSVQEGNSGRTPGRWLMKTMAVDADTGQPIGFGRAFFRRFCVQYPGVLFFLVAYPWMIWDKKHQTLYDKMFETVVIMDPSRQSTTLG